MSDPTHRITVNFRNCDHWHWSLNGGTDSMVMTGTTADIVAPIGGTLIVRGVDANHNSLTEATTQLNPPVYPSPSKLASTSGGAVTIGYNWGSTTKSFSNDRSYSGCYPNHYRYYGADVVLPAELNVPETGSVALASFYVPKNVGSGNPAATAAEWAEYQAYVDSGQPFTRVVGRSTQQVHNLGPYASGAKVFKCGTIGWNRGRNYPAPRNDLTSLVTVSLTSDGDIISSDSTLFDPASVIAAYEDVE